MISFMGFQLKQLETSSKFIVSRWNMISLRVLDIFTIVFLLEIYALFLFGRMKGTILSYRSEGQVTLKIA